MRALAERRGAGLLYATNFSVGVQVMLRLAREMGSELAHAGYTFSVEETHHTGKLDSPSGTAVTLSEAAAEGINRRQGAAPHDFQIPIEAIREGDTAGIHRLEARSPIDRLVLTHEALSRRGFAEGAVRAAEWLAPRTGVFDFKDIFLNL